MRALGDGLVRAGLAEPVLDTDTLTLKYGSSASWSPTCGPPAPPTPAPGGAPGLTGRQAWARLADAYELERDADGLLPATVEVVFGQAWAPGAPRRRRSPGDEITVPLDSLGRRPA